MTKTHKNTKTLTKIIIKNEYMKVRLIQTSDKNIIPFFYI